MSHPYRIREIAVQAGLSEATVDRVLNERPGVRANTRSEVMQAIADLDKQRAQLLGRDRRVERGTELDVAGAYSAVFMSMKRTGTRTSLIVDPPNGRLPALTPGAAKMASDEREFRLALLQATGAMIAHCWFATSGDAVLRTWL